MSVTSDLDGTSPRYLRDKYAIVGVGETAYMRGSGKTTRALATWAVRNAIADAGLKPADIDGMLSYPSGDSTFVAVRRRRSRHPAQLLHGRVRRRVVDRGAVGIAIGVIEAGMCKVVVIFRAMNGFSQVRIGGTGVRAAAPVSGDMLHSRAYGWQSAGQMFAPPSCGTCTTTARARAGGHGESRSTASTLRTTRKRYYKKRVTVDDVLASRIICKPLHLLDCCVETDNANAIIVTRPSVRSDLRHQSGR